MKDATHWTKRLEDGSVEHSMKEGFTRTRADEKMWNAR